jgi:hypothetical protein
MSVVLTHCPGLPDAGENVTDFLEYPLPTGSVTPPAVEVGTVVDNPINQVVGLVFGPDIETVVYAQFKIANCAKLEN